MANKKKKKKTLGDYFLTLILLIAVGVFCFAGYNLFKIYMEYKKGTDEYNHIAEIAVTDREPDKQSDAGGDVQGDSAAGSGVKAPIEVDFGPLRSINTDVIGWLYVEAINSINYPVVKGKDNDEYLHATYERNYNFAGTIFIDYENQADFSDCNTIIYGHNMKNGSMFGSLKKFSNDPNVYKTSPYIWMLTPAKNYRYEVFASYVTAVNSDTYTLFKGPGSEFLEWIRKMRLNSAIETSANEFDVTDKVITLSTCTGDYSTRYVVQARLTDVEIVDPVAAEQIDLEAIKRQGFLTQESKDVQNDVPVQEQQEVNETYNGDSEEFIEGSFMGLE
ncbi:MAG: class B sortase [Blautia sp.]|nr:class B sortase [Blautia sp.]